MKHAARHLSFIYSLACIAGVLTTPSQAAESGTYYVPIPADGMICGDLSAFVTPLWVFCVLAGIGVLSWGASGLIASLRG